MKVWMSRISVRCMVHAGCGVSGWKDELLGQPIANEALHTVSHGDEWASIDCDKEGRHFIFSWQACMDEGACG